VSWWISSGCGQCRNHTMPKRWKKENNDPLGTRPP
jgi:hypothetical protein